MKLPNGDRAQLGDKLERYCLNPDHRKDKDKAALVRDRLGITLNNRGVLESALLAAALGNNAVVRSRDQYGYHYNIRFLMQTDVRRSLGFSLLDYPPRGRFSSADQCLPC
ncbi:DUF6883 domain-containing protein [Leptolyngbya sp. CCNP1308]|uniref:DUF6883 domain-containing protein n=1 Tax=Leptolyngbya sp. CCNP1308 TaxID=3110255 RepID=UPI003A5993E4